MHIKIINKNLSKALAFIIAAAFLISIIATGCGCAAKNGSEEEKYSELRNSMVDNQIVARGIEDVNVTKAMRKVPRHEFVDKDFMEYSYEDSPLPIGVGQTISQPSIVALMTESLEITGSERVLEIGTGSGYQAAVLSEIVDEVYSVEIITFLHQKSNIALSDYPNVKTSNHDGYYGWEEYAPFDRIIVTAAAPKATETLLSQLNKGGKMVVPVGNRSIQDLKLIEKALNGRIYRKSLGGCRFVPLIGKEGWRD